MEALACDALFARAEAGDIEIVWSFMHDDENALCPYPDRQIKVLRLSDICKIVIAPDVDIKKRAVELNEGFGVSPKDALHLAAAERACSEYFLTCDDGITAKADRLPLEFANRS
jgi:predicted nucleic acid-binding protein